ncbi:MAG TPA: MATE family efflux transporter [Syntrophomonadaceae bacterium]|nr:MATE family efflux transporter [Syntrophomonadaceae bacterium]
MDRSDHILNDKIGSLLWKFSLPAIVGMVVNSLYNVVDRIFVGRGVGSLGIAATTVAFPIMTLMLAVSVLIGVGTTALISIRLGQQKQEEAEQIAGNGMALLILLPALLILLFFAFSEPILIACGAGPEVMPYARDFALIIVAGGVFSSFGMGANNFIRAEGNPKMSMYTQILGAVANVILNYLFIFVFGWGMRGSAIATVSAQLLAALWVFAYFYSGRSLVKIRLRNLRPRWPVMTGILAIGLAPFGLQLAASVQQVILNQSLVKYSGEVGLAAIGIVFSIATLLFMPVLGVAQGAQPIIGFNYGAGQYDRVRETLKTAIFAGTAISTLGYLAVRIWPQQLVGLFSQGDTALTELTIHAIMVYMALIWLVGYQVICSNYFQAVGKARQAIVLSLSRQVLFFIPLLLILPRFWGVEGIWRAAPIADFLAVAFTSMMLYFEMKTLGKQAASPPTLQSRDESQE